MAENFAAAASSSPLPPRRAACALQRVHGAGASRVPAAATAAPAATAAAARRNLSHRLPPLLPGFRTAAAHAPQPRPAGPGSAASRVRHRLPGWRRPEAAVLGTAGSAWRLGETGSLGEAAESRAGKPTRRRPAGRERATQESHGEVFADTCHLSPRYLREVSPEPGREGG